MKTTYAKDERKLRIIAESRLAKRRGRVFNPKTQLFDIETGLGAENPRTGEIWCEDIPVIERYEFGRPYKAFGKWVSKDLIHVI